MPTVIPAAISDIGNLAVAEVFSAYPEGVQQRLLTLRQLVLDTAAETAGVEALHETLKWGEPSYLAKGGSTVRMDWKPAKPDQYALYFHCKTTLVDTFKELYGDRLHFEGNRAIVFTLQDEIPVAELRHCISLALTYHGKKHLPLLGA